MIALRTLHDLKRLIDISFREGKPVNSGFTVGFEPFQTGEIGLIPHRVARSERIVPEILNFAVIRNLVIQIACPRFLPAQGGLNIVML